MVRVHVWRAAALLMLCQARLHGVGGKDFDVVSEKPIDISTSAAALASGTAPIWLVLPLLLDVHPALLRVDVKRHVPAQIQGFCSEHGMEVAHCAGVIHDTLDGVVNLQRFCRRRGADDALPGFIVAKNVVRSRDRLATASWVKDDPVNIAAELCSFIYQQQSGATDDATEACFEVLDSALALSFEWMLALTPCETHALGGAALPSSKDEPSQLSERLSSIERMIAAMVDQTHLDKESAENEQEAENRGDPQVELVGEEDNSLVVEKTVASSLSEGEDTETESTEFEDYGEGEFNDGQHGGAGAIIVSRGNHGAESSGEKDDDENKEDTLDESTEEQHYDSVEATSAVGADAEEEPVIPGDAENEATDWAKTDDAAIDAEVDTPEVLDISVYETLTEEEGSQRVGDLEERYDAADREGWSYHAEMDLVGDTGENAATEAKPASDTLRKGDDLLITADENEDLIRTTEQPSQESAAKENRSYPASHSVLDEEQPQHLTKDAEIKMWAFAATLAMLLAIAYLAVDLLLICTHHAMESLASPKHVGGALLHSVFGLFASEAKRIPDCSSINNSNAQVPSEPHSPRNANAQIHIMEPSGLEESSTRTETPVPATMAIPATIDEEGFGSFNGSTTQVEEDLTDPTAGSSERDTEGADQPLMEEQGSILDLLMLTASVTLPGETSSDITLVQVENEQEGLAEALPPLVVETSPADMLLAADEMISEEEGEEGVYNERELSAEPQDADAGAELSSEEEEIDIRNEPEEQNVLAEEEAQLSLALPTEEYGDAAASSDAASEGHEQENLREPAESPEVAPPSRTSLGHLDESGLEEQYELAAQQNQSEMEPSPENAATNVQALVATNMSPLTAAFEGSTVAPIETEVVFPLLRSSPHRFTAQPSFTCVAMALMVGNHASFFHRTASKSMAQCELSDQPQSVSDFWASLPSSGKELVELIRRKGRREQVAARCIQRTWKSMRHCGSSSTEQSPSPIPTPVICPPDVFRGHMRAIAPIFRLLHLRNSQQAKSPLVPTRVGGVVAFTGSAVSIGGYHRLASNRLPPC